MVRVEYSHRVLCNSNFLDWLSQQPDREQLLSRLMHIKSSSKYHRGEHNIILESEEKICMEMPKINQKYLGGAFKSEEDPEFLSIHTDHISKNIIFAIYLTHFKPYACVLLTSPEKEKNYKLNQHYNKIKRVVVLSSEEAKKSINDYFRAFVNAREIERL